MRIAKRQLAGSGEALPSGAVGEKKEVSGNYTGVTTAGTTLTSVTLEPGVWIVTFGGASLYGSGSVSALAWVLQLTTNASLNPTLTEYYSANSLAVGFGNSGAASTLQLAGNPSKTLFLNVTSSTTYYVRLAMTATGGGVIGLTSDIKALRIN